VHFPSENGVSGAFLICDIAVRPIPERMHNSALLNCRWGNFTAKKSNAAMVVVENESFSAGLSCFADFDFIFNLSFVKLSVTRKTSRLRTEAVRAGPPAEPTVASLALIFLRLRFCHTSTPKTRLSRRFSRSLANLSTIFLNRGIT
jgi:hypothetical protein